MTYLTGYTGNLTVAGNINPATSNTYSLGGNTAKWADTHIGPNSIYIQDTANANLNASLTVTNGVLFINGATQVQAPGLQNGNSNIAITANANVNFTSNSNTTFKVTSTGANVIGDLGVSGNIIGNTTGNVSLPNSNVTVNTLSTTGNANIGGNLTVTGNIFFNPVYGQFWSNLQQNATADTATAITLNNGGGDSRVTNTNGLITISHAGIYQISASVQAAKGAGGNANLFVWFKQNGVNIPNSAYYSTVEKQIENLTTATWVANVAAGGNLQAFWQQNDTVVLNTVAAAGSVPEIPSVIVSITPVGA
jgi:hypothetical protein